MVNILGLIVILSLNWLLAGLNNKPISGEIYNAATQEPVPYVNIWVKAAGIRLTSNADGKFILNLNSEFAGDTIVFSSIGYKPFATPIRQLLENKLVSKKIYLHEDIVPLQEVLIRPLTAKQIIQKGIEAIPENHLATHFQVHGFYRKAIKENNVFASLMESVINITETATNKHRQVNYVKTRSSKDFRIYKQVAPEDAIRQALDLDHVQYERGFLSRHHLNNWQFIIAGLTRLNHQEIYIIKASLLGAKKPFAHLATIYIRASDYAFQKIDYDYTWNSTAVPEEAAPSDTLLFKKYHWKGSFNYTAYKNKMVLNYFHFTLKQHVYAKGYVFTGYGRVRNNTLLATQESHEEFLADSFKVLSSRETKAAVQTTSGLLASAQPYDTLLWKTYRRPADSKLFTAIKADLENHAPLEDLFWKEEI